jgi:plastocyanin
MLRFQVPIGLVLLLSTACGSGPSESAAPRSPEGAPAGKKVDPATAGTINGRVTFAGTPPRPAELKITDSKCPDANQPARDESIAVADGGLANVFVYIKDGVTGYAFQVPSEPVKLDQDGCMYTPRVLGVRVGQPLNVINSDPAPHNVHAAAKVNQQVNTGQPFKGMVYTHSFSASEIMVPFKCDIHPWMIAYVGVVDHPYFAVSARDGTFTLKEVPPGTYTVEAWHEKLGTRTASVTIGEKESKDLSFAFEAS